MALKLEQISNENLVNFYKKELKMIDLGEPASTFFSRSAYTRLLKKGILRRSRRPPPTRSKIWIITISDMTRTLISRAE